MKLHLIPQEDLATCVVEPKDDHFTLAFAAPGFLGNSEESIILTFTEEGYKHVEVVIPIKVWDSFAQTIWMNRSGSFPFSKVEIPNEVGAKNNAFAMA